MSWLRNHYYTNHLYYLFQARKELDQLISRFREEKEEMIRKRNSEHGKESSNRCCGTISKPQVFKPFIIVSVFYLVQVISGTYLVIFYAVEVITQAGGREGLGIDRFFAAVLTAADRLFFTFIMCFLLLRVGRRPLALVSGECALCGHTSGQFRERPHDGQMGTTTVTFRIYQEQLTNIISVTTDYITYIPGKNVKSIASLPLRIVDT
ncbi:hypothetical protein C0J52_27876 [Blattella germanica]|nr:hypothetical protein C0J52_27876 [Blattella germanica]